MGKSSRDKKADAALGLAVIGSVLMIHSTGRIMHLGDLVSKNTEILEKNTNLVKELEETVRSRGRRPLFDNFRGSRLPVE